MSNEQEKVAITFEDCPVCRGQNGNTTCDYCLGYGKIIHAPAARDIVLPNPTVKQDTGTHSAKDV